MKTNDETEHLFEEALQSLRQRPNGVDLCGFEHRVWTEVAIREGQGGWLRCLHWLQGGRFLMPAPATAAVAAGAVLAGISLGLAQAKAYGERASLDMEQRYVESIHPVMMSTTHDTHAGHLNHAGHGLTP